MGNPTAIPFKRPWCREHQAYYCRHHGFKAAYSRPRNEISCDLLDGAAQPVKIDYRGKTLSEVMNEAFGYGVWR